MKIEIELKPELYICMTSGVEGPKIDLTDQQVKYISNLVGQIKDPWNNGWPGSPLGQDVYAISLPGEKIEYFFIRQNRCFNYWDRATSKNIQYIDTVGLWAYLALIAAEALNQWYTKFVKSP